MIKNIGIAFILVLALMAGCFGSETQTIDNDKGTENETPNSAPVILIIDY